MKKLIVAVLFLLLIGVSHAQQAYQANTPNIVATGQYCSNAVRCNITNTGAAFHQLTWTVSGTLSACSVQVDSSADAITWNSGGVIASQTCTSNGVITSTSHIVNFVRVNVTALTPVSTASLAVNLIGYVNLPSGGGTVTNISTTAPITGGPITSAGTLACADCIVDNPAGTQTIQGPATNSTLTLLGAVGTSSLTLDIHNSFAAGINAYTHSDTGFRAASIIAYRSRGTQASPTALASGDNLSYFSSGGYDGAAYAVQASYECFASQIWAVGAHGTTCGFFLTPPNSTSLQNTLQLGSITNGCVNCVGINNQNPAATFALQTQAGGRIAFGVPNSATTDADLLTNQASWYDDETNNQLKARIKYNGGGLHLATIPIDNGPYTASKYNTLTNCSAAGSAASPSLVACTAAAAGAFSCATNASGATCVISTTAVTTNSDVIITQTASAGTRLSVTCNTTADVPTGPRIASISNGVSFTINLGTVAVNPTCYFYHIVN